MYAKEAVKSTFKRLTGIGRPPKRAVDDRVVSRTPWITLFPDDGLVPNNPDREFIHYRSAVNLRDAEDPAAVLEVLFEMNGWTDAWRNGIYDHLHYHPRIHEVLGIASGRARVRFGGDKGKVFALKAGDVVILPAGTGHGASGPLRKLWARKRQRRS